MGQAKSGNSRVEWVDAAKGVGILLVIAGHDWWKPGLVHHMIYAFHMPLFFLLSGYMVKPQPTGPLILRQVQTLLVPYAAFSLLLIATDMTVEGIRGARPIFSSVGEGVWAILFRTETLRGPFTILWFIPCLFFARIAWNVVAVRWPDATDWRWPVLVALVMVAAHWVTERTVASPMGLIAVPAAFAMYWVGQLWRVRPPGTLMLVLLVPLALAVLFWLPAVNLKPGDFGMPFFSLAGAAAVSILLCLGIERLPAAVVNLLAQLGRASLVIMYVHVAFIHYCAPYVGKPLLFVIALAGSLMMHAAASATRPGRMVLLGART
jgi:fucose 4-O-acetylase-like acetyltransferase